MSGAELGLAVVATIDLVLRHGKRLVKVCRDAKTAEQEIEERIICIEHHWTRTTIQLDFLRRIWPSLDVDSQFVQEQVLQILDSKLNVAVTKIAKLVAKNSTTSRVPVGPLGLPWKRWKYALMKDDLDKVIKDLENWQRTFDPSWFATMMIASPNIDVALKASKTTASIPVLDSAQMLRNLVKGSESQRSVFLPEDELMSAHVSDIPLSSCQIAQRAGSSRLHILNSISVSAHGSSQQLIKDIRELATRLYYADPVDFGLLGCKGVIQRRPTFSTGDATSSTEFTMVFGTLQGYSAIQSFRAWLHAGPAKHSLSERLDIAVQMARSISSVHTFGFVHKNFRPENILLCAPTASSLGKAFLVGFEEFRSVDGSSLHSNDSAWEKELYRHPSRQGTTPSDSYVMQHDIYSLGVCLLELGLWESFVLYDEGQCSLSPTLVACSEELLFSWQPDLVKQILLSLAQNVLPLRMGTKFSKVVETCLTCLDDGNIDFGQQLQFRQSNSVLVGVRYIEKVLLQLGEISM